MEKGQRTDLTHWRAAHVEVLRLARVLQSAATVFRRCAGTLRYRPQMGLEVPVGGDLLAAAVATHETLAAVASLAARWDEEITWLRTVDAAIPVDDIQRGHAAAREAATFVRAALDIFDRAVAQPEVASLDAPYGSGAPRRVHPGAQCTWVAERADGLARALSTVTLRKENLLLSVLPP